MSRSKSLKLLQLLRSAREREAARSYAATSAQEAGERERLESLESWQADYLRRQRDCIQEGQISPTQLRLWRGFIDQLDAAVQRQRSVVNNRARETQARERDWADTRKDQSAVDTLASRAKAEAGREEAQREQNETDEAARRRRR